MLKRVYRRSKRFFKQYRKARRIYIRWSLAAATLVAFWPMIEKVFKAIEKIAK